MHGLLTYARPSCSPTTADMIKATTFAVASRLASSNASVATKIDIVNPMPPQISSTATALQL